VITVAVRIAGNKLVGPVFYCKKQVVLAKADLVLAEKEVVRPYFLSEMFFQVFLFRVINYTKKNHTKPRK
jgi:hypothetical protein